MIFTGSPENLLVSNCLPKMGLILPPISKSIGRERNNVQQVMNRLLEDREAQVQLQTKIEEVNVTKDNANYRTERELNIHHFRTLLNIFKTKAGTGTMDREEFKECFSTVMGSSDAQMDSLFLKIDTDLNNSINWDDFSTFMLLRAEGQKKMREEAESQLFSLDPSMIHRLPLSTPHRDHIGVILHLPVFKRYITVGRDGIVCYWSEAFKLLRKFKQEESGEVSRKQPNNWVHDCRFLSSCNKLLMAADDHCISFHDLGTAKCDLRLNIGDQIPLSIDVYYDAEHQKLNDTMIVYGTDAGVVAIFNFCNDALFQFTKSGPLVMNIEAFVKSNKGPSCSLVKKKLHSDWCVKVRYYPSLRSIISCSPDPKESLVVQTHQLGGKKWSSTSLAVHKGVNTFAYCKFPAVLVTAGTDRQLRIWNVHRLTNPMAALRGHAAPVIDLVINETSGRIISLSTDKVIKVWDVRTQTCVQTLNDPFIHRPEDTLCSIHFNPGLNNGTLVCASSTMTPYQLQASKRNVTGPTRSHDFPLRAAIFNPEYNQIVSGCDGGVVNVWDLLTGQKTFRLNVNQNGEEITAMNFDANYRRLITGGRSGALTMWNFNNGQVLHELTKISESSEITGVLYIEMKECFYIVATGWCRRVILYKYTEKSSFTLQPERIWPDPSLEPWHTNDILGLL